MIQEVKKEKKLNIDEIRNSILNGNYRVSDHAFDEMDEDNLDLENVLHSVENGEIIEVYPKSRIAPSCLISGNDYESNPVHSVWGYFKEKIFSVLVTVYKPNETEWMDDKKTRRKS